MSLPTIDLSALMGCSLPMQCDGINWKQTPVIQSDVGKISNSISATIEGFLSSADQTTLAAAIVALSSRSQVSGSDVTVTGPGNVTLHRVLAADCYEGGPHVGFEVLDGDGGCYRRVRATVQAKAYLSTLLHSYRVRTTTKPDGLIDVEQSGTILENVPGTQFPTVLAAFQSTYNSSNYIISYEKSIPTGVQVPLEGPTTAITDLTCSYRISASQLASALPSGGTVTVVNGEVSVRTDRDEQQRLTTVASYKLDLKVTGTPDYQSLVTALRPAGVQIVGESVNFSSIHGWKLECSFTSLSSADGDTLLQFEQTIKRKTNDQSYEVYTYPGANPIAVARSTTFGRFSQSGSQTGLGVFLNPPGPLLTYYAEPPTVTYTDVSNYEKRTEWQYEFLDLTGTEDLATLLAAIARTTSAGLSVVS